MYIPLVKIDPDRKYWFVRTQQGKYYKHFLQQNFIGIGWNKIKDLKMISPQNSEKTIRKIKELYPNESRARHAFNQLYRFCHEMKKGDIVLIPSKRSSHITFGVITSDPYIEEPTKEQIIKGECPFNKRRSVSWLKTIRRKDLEPRLYQLFYSQHTISNASSYSQHIDRTLHHFYLKGKEGYLVLDVKKKSGITFVEFSNILNSLSNIIDEFNKKTGSRIDKNEIQLKTNVESPGLLIFVCGALAITLIGVIFHFTVGGNFNFKFSSDSIEFSGETEGLLEKILKFKSLKDTDKEVQSKLQEVKNALEAIEAHIPQELEPEDYKRDKESLLDDQELTN